MILFFKQTTMGCCNSTEIEPLKIIRISEIPDNELLNSIIPKEINFNITRLSDGQYFLLQSDSEIKHKFKDNKKRWTIGQLRSMNFPLHDKNYLITITFEEYDLIIKQEIAELTQSGMH